MRLILQADDIETDAGGAQRHLGLLVEADRGRRVECDAVPDQLSATLVEADIHCKAPREIRAFHFEAARTGEALVERDVVQQGSDRDDFRVVFDVLKLSDPRCKEPGADDVIEQVGFAFLPRIFDRPVNDWRRRNLYSRQYSIID